MRNKYRDGSESARTGRGMRARDVTKDVVKNAAKGAACPARPDSPVSWADFVGKKPLCFLHSVDFFISFT